jgi:DNA-binding NarL/FixJ family response regulator
MRAKYYELANGAEKLTPRESDIVPYLLRRLTDNEIAKDMKLSINTIKFHKRNIYAKWGVHRRKDVIAYVLSTGRFDPKIESRV